jgi:UPF0716 protein FxsA
LLLSLVSAAIGVLLARSVGLRQLRQWQTSLAQGRAPNQNVVDALLMLLACAWLIIPGVLSDALALVLLIPPVRHWLAARATAHVLSTIERGTMQVNVQMRQAPQQRGDVIDAEGETVEPEATSGGSRKMFTP